MTALVLASASPIRSRLLTNAGVAHQTCPVAVDEGAIKDAMLAEGAPPRDIADALAEMKAFRAAQRNPDSLILGCDQVLVFKGGLVSKPRNLDEARAQLVALRGQSHELLSAAVVFEAGRPVWRKIGRVQLIMRAFSDAFLDDYIARTGDDLLATVGGYKLEAEGVHLFSRIQGDYFSVLGLPLLEVLDFLRSREVILT